MEISMHVKKLETLFDKLYSDTFSVVKETVSDMRKQLWSEKTSSNDTSKIDAEAEKKAEGKIKEIKKDFKEELAQIFDTKHIDKNVTNNEIKNIRKELLESFEKAITESRNIDLEAREKTLKDFIRKFIKKKLSCINNGTATAKDFLPWIKQEGLAPKLVFKEIEEMSKEGKLNTSHEKITGPYVEIRMN